MMYKLAPILAIIITVFLASCAGGPKFSYEEDPELQVLMESPGVPYPDGSFAVISDLHIYDPELGTEGEAFEEYLGDDRKLLRESVELLYNAVTKIGEKPPDFVLVPGDLTKDGALSSHRIAAHGLRALQEYGVKVFVVPGNHDVLNPHAYSYQGAETVPVQSITPDEFREMYWDSGYGSAVMLHDGSLSYVAEPVEGLWILAMDPCRYKENEAEDYPVTDGRFSNETLAWIERVLIRALREGKAVIGMMHHGILEHYETQNKYYGEYIVDNYRQISEMFAHYNMRLVFTGHYHAQDIAHKQFDSGKWLYDIETGSLVTYPCPVRYIQFTGNTAFVQTETIDSLPSFQDRGISFREYSYDYVFAGIEGIAYETMRDYRMRENESRRLAPLIARAMVAHYAGDEQFDGTEREMLPKKGLSLMGRLVAGNRRPFIRGLWNDPEPEDNRLRIDLGNGEWSSAP
ncbi:MAG: metallophosphoesterase family protein [Spirochaetia bacterium]